MITDGPLPEVASAALKADGLSIIEAKDELQATGDRRPAGLGPDWDLTGTGCNRGATGWNQMRGFHHGSLSGGEKGAVGSYGCIIMFRVYKKRSQIAFPKHIIAKAIGPGL